MASTLTFSTGVTSTAPATGTVSNGGKISDSLLGTTVSEILGLQTSSTLADADAKAQDASVTGYKKEADLYGDVSTLADSNAAIAQASGDIKDVQEQQKLSTDIGTEKAAFAANGFKAAGSNVDILRSSLQQGYLTQQLNETQTALNVGGYLAEGLGAKAEGAAATAAADSAQALSTYYTSASALYKANTGSATDALNSYLKDASVTPAEQLILSPISSSISAHTSTATDAAVVGGGTATSDTTQSTTTGTASGYKPNSTVMIGGVSYATDASGRVVIKNKGL